MLSKRPLSLLLLGSFFTLGVACSSAKPPPPPPPVKSNKPPPPSGPTRTDFKIISKKLVQRCVAGGWISKWRSTHENIDVAKPKIHLRDFEDKTKQDLDPTYLNSILEKRMQLSGVYEMVASDEEADFIGRGQLLRQAERTGKGTRFSVYTAILKFVDPKTQKTAYSCESSVQGEM